MSITVVPYADDWATEFDREAEQLRRVLQPWVVADLHHVGSTAIPGLAAKPILDMIAGVGELQPARAAIPVLAELGYQHADHRPDEAIWFFKQLEESYASRTHQLHLTTAGSALWLERLAFRDSLRADLALRTEYQALKESLAADSGDLVAYTDGKREFVRRVLRLQGIELR